MSVDSFNSKLVNSFNFSIALFFPRFLQLFFEIFHCISLFRFYSWFDILGFLPTSQSLDVQYIYSKEYLGG